MNPETILLVEDNPDDIDLTLRAFRRGKIANEVLVLNDGSEALAYLFGTGIYAGRDTFEKPAVVLLGIGLPKINGLEVLRRLREDQRTRLLPVVILTSCKEEQDVINGYRLGCNSYVRKPVEFDEFAGAVTRLGLHRLLMNEPLPKESRMRT